MRSLHCLCLMACIAAADQTPIERARELRDATRGALSKGDLACARAAVEEAVVDDFFQPDVWFLLGHTLDRQGEHEAAFLAWEFGRRLWPEKVEEYFPADNWGRSKPAHDRSPARLDVLRAKMGKASPTQDILREAASICISLERWDEARGYLAQIDSGGGAEVEDFLALMEVLRKLNDEARARETLTRALEQTHGAPPLVAQQAWDLMADGKTAEADRVVQECLNAHGDDPSLWQCAGQLSMLHEDWKGARQAFCEAVRIRPDLATVWSRISAIDSRKLDDPEGAFGAGYQAYRRAPDLHDEEYLEERMHRSLDELSTRRLRSIADSAVAGKLLEERDPFRRMEAIAWFASHPSEEAVSVFRRSLADTVPEVRMAATQALVVRGDPEAIGTFVAGLDDPRPAVAASSLYGYVLLQGTQSLARLRAAARSEFSVVRYAAYLGLWQMRSEEAKGLLDACLNGETDKGLLRMVHVVIGGK